MTGTALYPNKGDMQIIVNELPDSKVLTVFCKFIDLTQTDAEKSTKSTRVWNRVGVSRVHAERCSELLERVARGGKVWRADLDYARNILVHYRRQITELELI